MLIWELERGRPERIDCWRLSQHRLSRGKATRANVARSTHFRPTVMLWFMACSWQLGGDELDSTCRHDRQQVALWFGHEVSQHGFALIFKKATWKASWKGNGFSIFHSWLSNWFGVNVRVVLLYIIASLYIWIMCYSNIISALSIVIFVSHIQLLKFLSFWFHDIHRSWRNLAIYVNT